MCGIIVALTFTGLDIIWRRKQLQQLKNLPTSKTRSAGRCLAEFSGRARKIVAGGHEPNAPIIVYRAWLEPHVEPFYLEDDGGRILVDPREAKIRDRCASSLGGRVREIVLTHRVQKGLIDAPLTMTLRDNDPVYLIGNVQRD